jgi:hypothetical protein
MQFFGACDYLLRPLYDPVTNVDNMLMTLKTNGEDTLTTLMTGGEDTLTTHFMTSVYLVTTPHDVTDDPCDSIDDLNGIHGPHD